MVGWVVVVVVGWEGGGCGGGWGGYGGGPGDGWTDIRIMVGAGMGGATLTVIRRGCSRSNRGWEGGSTRPPAPAGVRAPEGGQRRPCSGLLSGEFRDGCQ